MLSIKDYAQKHNVSYEAVRKQVVRYRTELGEHIIKQGRKQFLDDEAAAFLDEKRRGSPIIVMEQAKDDTIDALTAENEALKAKVMQLQEQIIARDEKVMQLQEQLLLLTAPPPETEPGQQEPETKDPEPEPVPETPARKWWQFWK